VASLWDALAQYLRDAAPGGALNPEVTPQGLLDTAAMATAPVPVAGDVVGLLADANRMRDPAERTPLNFGLMALGALPFVPSALAHAGLVKGSRGARAWANQDGAIKVFHGSPHKFDKFDLSKIGTGEGAQAYGHGAYVAESPAVAQDYATGLSQRLPDRLKVDGNAVRGDSIYSRALEDVAMIGKDGALQKLDDNIRFNEKYAPDTARLYKSVREQIAAIDPARVDLNRGNLYEASLRWPDAAREAADPMGPQHFLDWDKPLYRQPKPVRQAVRGLVDDTKGAGTYAEWVKAARPDFQNLRTDMLEGMDESQIAADLLKRGIPGVRYLDAGSRGKSGTSNYVVFDDALIDILTRNGVPVK